MILREALQLGAYGLRRYYNYDLAIGFAAALVLHMLLLLFSVGYTTTEKNAAIPDTVATGPVVLIPLPFGGSGGMPELDEPVGLKPKGERIADAKQVEGNEHMYHVVPKRTSPGKDKTTTDRENINNPTNQPQKAVQSSDKGTERQGGDTGSSKGGSPAYGDPGGKGNKPAGGSGGSTVGVDGEGIGRCWQRSPKAMARGAVATENGTVVVAFTVKPDGKVVNIRKVSGSTSLFNQARRLLTSARACPALGSPDVEVTRLSYTFQLK